MRERGINRSKKVLCTIILIYLRRQYVPPEQNKISLMVHAATLTQKIILS